MRSFFSKDQVNNSCSRHIEYSRSFEKGKSFNCTEFVQGEAYYNNDFLQDFVIYENALYACARETRETPSATSNDWRLIVRTGDILDATATVDNSVGTPRVEVETTGEGLDKQFHFSFFNLKGERGFKGDKGDTGERGPQGIQGIQGEVGPQGKQGPRGEKGEKGDKGDKGDKGERGLRGPKGEQGLQGLQGIRGERGFKGEKGDTGETGPRGMPGATGPQGEKGPQGEQGPKGDKGESGNGNFEIGTSEPTQSGYENDVYLNITTGIFYRYNTSWEVVGQISVNGVDIDLDEYYTKSEINEKFDEIDFPETDLTNYYTKPEVDQQLKWQDD